MKLPVKVLIVDQPGYVPDFRWCCLFFVFRACLAGGIGAVVIRGARCVVIESGGAHAAGQTLVCPVLVPAGAAEVSGVKGGRRPSRSDA
jgi:hypothetical protein